jgi:hypothetical protein
MKGSLGRQKIHPTDAMEKKKPKQKENARKSPERLMKHVNFSPIRQQLCIHVHRLLSIVTESGGGGGRMASSGIDKYYR